jgi:hypothetical protein
MPALTLHSQRNNQRLTSLVLISAVGLLRVGCCYIKIYLIWDALLAASPGGLVGGLSRPEPHLLSVPVRPADDGHHKPHPVYPRLHLVLTAMAPYALLSGKIL